MKLKKKNSNILQVFHMNKTCKITLFLLEIKSFENEVFRNNRKNIEFGEIMAKKPIGKETEIYFH